MAVVFREGHCSLSGKIMRTIFHSIKLLHLAQLATHTKVKDRDLFLYDREEWCMCMREEARHRKRVSLHNLDNVPLFKMVNGCLWGYQCKDECQYCTFP